MASKIQSPESYEKQNNHTLDRCHSDSLELPQIRGEGLTENKDYEHTVLQQLHRTFPLSSNSPLSNDFEGPVNAWPDRLELPVNDFERYDREPPSCSAYETIASEDMDESLHATDNNYSCNFPQEACDMTQPRMNEMSTVDLYNDIAIQQQGEGSDTNSCLDWPTVQQDVLGFNELSDVIVDSNRLNKETTILLKLLDDGVIPPTVTVCIGSDGVSKHPLVDYSNTNIGHAQQTLQQDTVNQQYSIDVEGKTPWTVQPTTTSCSYDSETQPCLSVSSDDRFEGVPFAHKLDFRAMIGKPLQSLEELAYEAKLERQHRRKEKNRECSRNFRYKQRLKEDCLKRGKLEKEVFLRSRLYERERFRNALVELARNCASCPKAMEFLSPYHESQGKENIPTFFEGQSESFTS